ncbi:hypothetical protein GUJ93_ZPchr0006g44571 [Zizania palustris]|uniref:Uncharacterized protein n=1 Tax=Zizania palustris TaxID=103762 RepID=A0A8J5TCQ9_ZIZPA|nr:hypothetical protein GUJ93_ZPchr0006g44571 [Zizania palustris]
MTCWGRSFTLVRQLPYGSIPPHPKPPPAPPSTAGTWARSRPYQGLPETSVPSSRPAGSHVQPRERSCADGWEGEARD